MVIWLFIAEIAGRRLAVTKNHLHHEGHEEHEDSLVQLHRIKCPLPQDVIPACFWRESRRKAWMPAPRLEIAGTGFAGMTAEYRIPICVELY